MGQYNVGQWVYSQQYGAPARILESREIWGHRSYHVWLPEQDSVNWVAESDVHELGERDFSAYELVYKLAAAKIQDILGRDTLLAPAEGGVIPLPHQVYALNKAMSGKQIRFLLADEVGLGKTIEAGLIVRELKLRRLIRRILIVVPKGLVSQWQSELKTHFHEDFMYLAPQDMEAWRRFQGSSSFWHQHDQVVTALDSVKPIDRRRGWSAEQIVRYNQERFESLVQADWDLVVFDEAHRIAGASDAVARHRLGASLAEVAPYLLLLTATPHQGKTDGFYRLVSMLDSDAFPNADAIVREQVQPYVIRTEKREAVDFEGKALFKPRQTYLDPIVWDVRHQRQQELYEAVSKYVSNGYKVANRDKNQSVGFLMVLMQRLVTSSTRAIRLALERRLSVLEAGESETVYNASDLDELDSQELLESVVDTDALDNDEVATVRRLVNLAHQCEMEYEDAKAERVADLINRLELDLNEPRIKILVFTEFRATQDMLTEYLEQKGFKVTSINGSMDIDERLQAQRDFRDDCQVMVSTEAGGEGLNLQFCHVVVNYDLPWNPMRLEQRIGRVDRIGQDKDVLAYNFLIKGTVEYRVQEVLQDKLKIILDEFGVDKTGDVLDSSQADVDFRNLYIHSMLDPDKIDQHVDKVSYDLKEKAEAMRQAKQLLVMEKQMDLNYVQNVRELALDRWLEQMVTNYIVATGGSAEKRQNGYVLHWPDNTVQEGIEFGSVQGQGLGMEDSRVAAIVENMPVYVKGQPVPHIRLKEAEYSVTGYWSLWRVGLQGGNHSRQRVLALFATDDGKVFMPVAERVWEKLSNVDAFAFTGFRNFDTAAFSKLEQSALNYGQGIYRDLEAIHLEMVQKEEEKGNLAFRLRRAAINRIGLDNVRNFRLRKLSREEEEWRQRMEKDRAYVPVLSPICLLYVEG